MLLIPHLLARTEQPQDGARIDAAHPLLAGRTVSAFLPAISAANLARGPGILGSHAAPTVALPLSMLASSITATNLRVTSDRAFQPTPAYPLTMIWVGQQGSTVNTQLAGITSASGISGSYSYIGGGSSTIVGYAARNNFGSALAMTAAVPGGSALGVELVIVAQSLSASDHRLCVNGSAVATATTNIGSMVVWDRVFFGQASSANSQQSAALIVASGGVGLTDEQMQQLSRDPREVYALFEPQRIWVPVSAGGAYSLSVTSGAYTLSGNDSQLVATRLLQATAGAYSVTGNDAVLTKGTALAVTPGAYAISGNDAALLVARLLSLTAGSYAITGNNAALTAARSLTATAGAYSITGSDVQLTYTPVGSYSLQVTPGAYAIVGSDAVLTAARRLALTAGAYAVTGSNVVLTYGVMHTLTVTPGSYTYTGNDAVLSRTLALMVTSGAYVYAGRSVSLTYSGLADGALDVVHLLSRVTPNVQLLAALTQTVRLQGHVPEFAGLSSPIP